MVEQVSVVRPTGRLDSATSPVFEQDLMKRIAEGHASIVLDLSKLTFISSAGLRVLLAAAKKAKQGGGKLALFGLLANVREVFSISGFDTIFSILPGRSAALAAVRE